MEGITMEERIVELLEQIKDSLDTLTEAVESLNERLENIEEYVEETKENIDDLNYSVSEVMITPEQKELAENRIREKFEAEKVRMKRMKNSENSKW